MKWFRHSLVHGIAYDIDLTTLSRLGNRKDSKEIDESAYYEGRIQTRRFEASAVVTITIAHTHNSKMIWFNQTVKSNKAHFNCFMKALLAPVLGFVIAVPSQAAAQDASPIKDGKAAKLACAGDSITGGFGVAKGMSWPDQIAKMLGSTCEVRSFDVGGSYLLGYQSTDAFKDAKHFNPDVVVIMLGTNDVRPLAWKNSKPNFVRDYLSMIKQFAELPSKPRIFICYPPCITEADSSEENLLELIPLMDEVAKETNAGIIDIHGAFKGKGELIPDKIHPNAIGQTLIATTVYKALTGNPPATP